MLKKQIKEIKKKGSTIKKEPQELPARRGGRRKLITSSDDDDSMVTTGKVNEKKPKKKIVSYLSVLNFEIYDFTSLKKTLYIQ